MRIIDFHSHLDTIWFDRPLIAQPEFLTGLDRCGVSAACIFTLMGLYGECPRHNDLLAGYARGCPQRLIPFATVDPKLGREAITELERCLSNPIFRGVKFHPWLQAFAPSMLRETMIAILECAAHYQVPVIFHDGTPPYSTTFQIAAVARWVPEATIVLGHAGLSDYVYAAGQLAYDIPNLYVCYCGPPAGELPYLLKTFGSDRVIFGSDYGVADSKILLERLDSVLEAGLEETTLDQVLYRNAARLLRLEEHSSQANSC